MIIDTASEFDEHDEISEFKGQVETFNRSKGIISFIIGNSNSNQNCWLIVYGIPKINKEGQPTTVLL